MKYSLKERLHAALGGLILHRYYKAWENEEKARQARAEQRLTETEQAAILNAIAATNATVRRNAFLVGASNMPSQIIYNLNTKHAQIEAKYLCGDFVAHIASDAKNPKLPKYYSSIVARDAAFAWQMYGALETLYRKQQNAR